MNRSKIEQKLADLGLKLPFPTPPVAAYVPAKRAGSLIFVSGQLPIEAGTLTHRGTVPGGIDAATATECAKTCALNAIAAALGTIGPEDELLGVVRIGCWVASDPGFTDQPAIANGASELLQAVFGDAGRHARAAVGSVALPLGTPVEIEVLFEAGSASGERSS
ncbi:MAG: RidA family protein [Planctomycetota bacterium]